MPKTKYSNAIFTNRFKKLFEADNITYSQLESQTGVSQSLLNNYYNGKGFPTIENLIKIAQYYRVSTDYLLGLSENRTTDKSLLSASKYLGVTDNLTKKIKENIDVITERTYITFSDGSIERMISSLDETDEFDNYTKEMLENREKKRKKAVSTYLNAITTLFDSPDLFFQIAEILISIRAASDIKMYFSSPAIANLSEIDKNFLNEQIDEEYMQFQCYKLMLSKFNEAAINMKSLLTDDEIEHIKNSYTLNDLLSISEFDNPFMELKINYDDIIKDFLNELRFDEEEQDNG